MLLTLGARPSSIAPFGWKISYIPLIKLALPCSLTKLLPFGRRIAPEPTSRIGESLALRIPLAKNLSGNGVLKPAILQGSDVLPTPGHKL